MSDTIRYRKRLTLLLAAALVAATGVVTAQLAPPPAEAAVLPSDPPTVAAEPLPTWQLNGVVWSTVVVGDIAYVTGSFTHARPPGQPVGSPASIPAQNIFAFDVTTGNPVPFNHSLNAQGLVIRANPQGTRLYVGGDFTAVDNVARGHIAAFDLTKAGSPLTGFNARTDGQVRGFAFIDNTVYAGGNFRSSNGQPRTLLAAYAAETGNLLPWSPDGGSNGFVWTMVAAPDKSRVIVGGSLTTLNGVSAYGMGSLDAVTGETLPWAANQRLRAAGANGAIATLSTDGVSIFGAGYAFGSGATFEGSFSADPSTGEINWMNDCLGDTYDTFPMDGVLYTVGHEHDCKMVDAFPDTSPRSRWQNATAERIDQTIGTYTSKDAYGWDFIGLKYTGLLHWFPSLAFGNYTSSRQAAWSIGGNGDYLVLGGEFPRVNSTNQQALTRFAKRGVGPSAKPVIAGSGTPTVVPLSDGNQRVVFNAMYDRDDARLLYDVYRNDGNTTTRIATIARDAATFWTAPTLGHVDTTAPLGAVVRYQVRGRDADGNTQWSSWSDYTTVVGATGSAYAEGVAAAGATHHWRLGSSIGSGLLLDSIGDAHATAVNVTLGAGGAIVGESDAAITARNNTQLLTQNQVTAAGAITVEAWLRTSTSRGGRVIGLSSMPTGTSVTTDRVLYLDNSGRPNFTVTDTARRTVTARNPIRDNSWHHVVAVAGTGGMELFVDGVRVARDQRATAPKDFTGYWRIGSDTTVGFANRPSDAGLAGDLDEVAIYPRALTMTEVQNRYLSSGRPAGWGATATGVYGQAILDDAPDLYWRLDETSGQVLDQSGSGNHGNVAGTVTRRQEGPVDSGRAATFNGSNGVVIAQQGWFGPGPFTAEVWFRTNTTRGGKLTGFGNTTSGLSSTYDRHIWLLNDGRLAFGTLAGTQQTVTSSVAYNDNQWHHTVATQGPDGMVLYVDGAEVASNDQAVGANAYLGYWRIGGDRVWSGTSNYFAGQLAEVAVYPRVLGSDDVLAHYVAAGRTAPNRPPNAAFAVTKDLLGIEVDGSASTDPDGPLAAYEWSFGDGATAEGPAASHTYSEPGTYQVALTVRDPQGLTHSKSQAVTVTTNQAPLPVFEVSTKERVVTLDASDSNDPDGAIASYAWDFGDGGAATGQTASHTYEANGTYTITLTVTDDRGTEASSAREVAVEGAPGPVAVDEFERTTTAGWGAADVGGNWTIVNGAVRFAVSEGKGKITLVNPGSGVAARLDGVSETQADLGLEFSLDKATTGGGAYVTVRGRTVPGVGSYGTTIRVLDGGAVQLVLLRTVGTTDTSFASQTVPDLTYSPGDVLKVRFQAVGTTPTTLGVKIWRDGEEPPAWNLATSDSTSGLQAPGGVGVQAYVSGSSTNLPITFSYDNLVLRRA